MIRCDSCTVVQELYFCYCLSMLNSPNIVQDALVTFTHFIFLKIVLVHKNATAETGFLKPTFNFIEFMGNKSL